jgi:mRNA-degrading endonuclease YafQ of YafQ-DinJ toxin-antitoxin module
MTKRLYMILHSLIHTHILFKSLFNNQTIKELQFNSSLTDQVNHLTKTNKIEAECKRSNLTMTVSPIREASMNQKEVMIYQITLQMMISEDSYNINNINNKILIKQEMSNSN